MSIKSGQDPEQPPAVSVNVGSGSWVVVRNDDVAPRASTGVSAVEHLPDQPGGLKYDSDKPPMALLPGVALLAVARVMGHGAEKYSPRNWEKGISYSRLSSAFLRHVFSWLSGERRDPESGLSHLAHAACMVLFLLQFEELGREDLDDCK